MATFVYNYDFVLISHFLYLTFILLYNFMIYIINSYYELGIGYLFSILNFLLKKLTSKLMTINLKPTFVPIVS